MVNNKLVLGAMVTDTGWRGGRKAKVVGFYTKPGPCQGWPLLRETMKDGTPVGGKWVGDPDRCEVVE
jgi:hypothetical protein